ncbi:MAG: PilZ domain-containing protein [Myxococcales bacterium]|nr:PilZ domain-containing protein [Myxococcales bacterium]
MFHDNVARQATRRILSEMADRRDSPRFDVPIAVRSGDRYRECFGRLSINGFYFETSDRYVIGQLVSVKLVLLGLGKEIEARGTVVHVMPAGSHWGVAARFDDMPFESERQIARWLDLMVRATRAGATP